MRILLSSNHCYPAFSGLGYGRQPKERPSGSGQHIHDLLAAGLALLGHEVFYLLPKGASEPLPAGVAMLQQPVDDVDIFHNQAYQYEDVVEYMASRGKPWVTTCHLDMRERGLNRPAVPQNWIYVSKTLAHSHGSERYVLNGIYPDLYRFSREKEDYFLFMAAMNWADDKGLDIVLQLAADLKIKLIVAGTGTTWATVNAIADRCSRAGAEFVGDTQGPAKANFLAKACGLLSPSKLNEACSLVFAEALMSGTPAICSDKGAYPELVSPDVGFVCHELQDYRDAIRNVGSISPDRCREKAWNEFHYLRMARDYVREYQLEIAANAKSS